MAAKHMPDSLPMLYRSALVERAGMNKEKRTVEVTFSTETPVSRWFGDEILDHDPKSIRMDRVTAGAAVLLEHDLRQRVGITEGGEIKAKQGRATVRFSKTPLGEQAMNEVEDGTLRFLSVGYRVHEFEMERPATDDKEACYRAIDWEPYEITFTGIPADPNARVRSAEGGEVAVKLKNRSNENMKLNLDKSTEGGGGTDSAPAILDAKNGERKRVGEILACAQRFRGKVATAMEQAQIAIEKDHGVDQFNRWVLDQVEKGTTGAPEQVDERNVSEQANLSIGQQIVRSTQYKAAQAAGMFKRSSRIELSIDVPYVPFKRATATTTVTGLTKYERPTEIVTLGQNPLLVGMLFAQGNTENTTIRYMREDTLTNAATALAEEGTYQESSWDLSEQDAPIRKCGVISRVTDEMLADSAAFASYLDARTQFMVEALQDNHLVNGTGASNQITGILATSGIQTQAAGAYPTPIDAMLAAKTNVQSIGLFPPDAILINPFDMLKFRLSKDANGQYLFGGPAAGQYGVGGYSNVTAAWGLPAVETTAIAQGTALVGAFKLGAQLWTRLGITIETSNSDASDFANGRVAVRAGLRHGLSVYRPAAFCTLAGIP